MRSTRRVRAPRRLTWLVATLAVLVLAPVPAQGEGTEEEEDDGLETLFVTAERKTTDLQETGSSVVLFTETMLEDRGIYDVKAVTDYVPNVKIHTNVGGNTGFAVNIRGAIKGDSIISREPVVGLYVDDVYLANMVGILFDVLDLEAVEVLRGPQGTLYGRNTNGGAIKLRTRAPTDVLSLRNDFTYGNFETLNNRTVLNMPLLGSGPDALLDVPVLGELNTRTAFAYLSRDGFIDAVRNDQIVPGSIQAGPVGARRLDDIDRWAVHHRSTWQPTDFITVDYIFDQTHVRENSASPQLSYVAPSDGDFFNTPEELLNGTLVGLGGVDLTPFIRNTRQEEIAQGLGANGRLLRSKLDVWGNSWTTTVDLPDVDYLGELTLKSITALRHKQSEEGNDIDGTGYRVFESAIDIDHQQFSQEVQLLGRAAEDRVEYVLGFFYFDEDGKATNDQDFFQDPQLNPAAAFETDFFHRIQKQSYAGYGQLDWVPPVLEDKLTVSGGIRYTYERSELDVLNTSTNPAVPPIDTRVLGRPKDSFDDVSGLFRTQYQFTPDVMGYFKVSTGFLSGGFNARNGNPATIGVPFDPETLLSYELGVRSDLLDRRVRFNGTFFYYDYDDIQVSVFDAGTGGATTNVVNAGQARIFGLELELIAQVFEGAELNVAYGYTNAEYEEFLDFDPVTMTVRDFADERVFPQTPEHSVVIGGQYTLPAFSWGTVLGRLDWSWNSDVNFSQVVDPAIDEDATWLLNGMIQIADLELPADAGTARIQVWGKNLTNEKFKEFGFNLGTLGWAVNTYTDPRTYGVTLVWEWEKL